MLYGIRDAEQTRLVGEGVHVRTYVPFGDDWYGYFMRRLAERPANLVVLPALALASGGTVTTVPAGLPKTSIVTPPSVCVDTIIARWMMSPYGAPRPVETG